MSPRTEEQNTQIKDMRREQILSAALKVFARQGFANTKIGDIAAGAGVSHGLVYHYFGSKEEVFSELLKRAVLGSSQSFAAASKMESGPLDKIRWFAGTILKSIDVHEDAAFYFMISIHAAIMDSTEENRLLIESSASSVGLLSSIIAEGQQSGELRGGDPFSMAMAFSAAIQGLAIYKLTVKDFKIPDPEILVNMLKQP